MTLRELAILSIMFFLLSLLLGFLTLYYRGSLTRLRREISIFMREPVYWSFDQPTSPKIYYNVSCFSSSPFRMRIEFLDENDSPLDCLDIEGNNRSSVQGERLFDRPPYKAILNLTGGKSVECGIQLSYYSVSTGVMVFLLALQLITSLIAVALSIIWFSEKIFEGRPEARGGRP